MIFKQTNRFGMQRKLRIRAFFMNSLLFCTFLLASLMLFFRYDLASRFNIVYGDVYDGNIEVSILEHWFNVFRGFSAWSQTFAFYPAVGTLGYNDGYFIFGLIYSIARGFGADPFLSSEIVNIVIKLAGFVGFYVLSRRAIGNSALFFMSGRGNFSNLEQFIHSSRSRSIVYRIICSNFGKHAVRGLVSASYVPQSYARLLAARLFHPVRGVAADSILYGLVFHPVLRDLFYLCLVKLSTPAIAENVAVGGYL